MKIYCSQLTKISCILAIICGLVAPKVIQLERIAIERGPSNEILGVTASSEYIPFTNINNVGYIAPIYLGTPQQEFKVIYDTGSSALFIQEVGCNSCTTNSNILIGYQPNFYDPTLSSTSNVSSNYVTLSYGSVVANGYSGTETIILDGQKIVNFSMVFVTSEGSNFGQKSSTYDGIMGLSSDTSYKNIYELGAQQNILSSELFAFDLKNRQMIVDVIPQEYTQGPIVANSVSDRWTFKTIGFTVGGQDQFGSLSYLDALIDSGTSFICIDSGIISMITQSNSNIVYSSSLGVYQIPNCLQCSCSSIESMPALTFYSEGAQITILSQDYMVVYGDYCLLGMSSNSFFGFIILGDAFMRSAIITYDKPNQQMFLYGTQIDQMTNPSVTGLMVILGIGGGSSFLSLVALLFIAKRTRETLFSRRHQYFNN